jgi:hypothetical protein
VRPFDGKAVNFFSQVYFNNQAALLRAGEYFNSDLRRLGLYYVDSNEELV